MASLSTQNEHPFPFFEAVLDAFSIATNGFNKAVKESKFVFGDSDGNQ